MTASPKTSWNTYAFMPSDSEFEEAYDTLKAYLKNRYDIEIKETLPSGEETLHGLSDDRVADFNAFINDGQGRSITLHRDIPVEFKVYSILHLFGHIIQNNLSEENRKVSTEELRSDPEYMTRLERYETQASQYGLSTLKATGQEKLIPWLCIIFRADWQFLQDVCLGKITGSPDKGSKVSDILQDRKEKYFPAALEGTDLEPLTLPERIEQIGDIEAPDDGYKIL